jgi:hypothetical protein
MQRSAAPVLCQQSNTQLPCAKCPRAMTMTTGHFKSLQSSAYLSNFHDCHAACDQAVCQRASG